MYSTSSALYNEKALLHRASPAAATVFLAFLLTFLAAGCDLPGATTPESAVTPVVTLPPATTTSPSMTSLHMIDAMAGWAITQRSILRTTDGGSHWREVTPGGAAAQAAQRTVADFLSASIAWVVLAQDNATSTPVFRTSDGGQTWQSATVQTQDIGIVQVTFINPRDGWLLSNRGVAAGSEAVDIWRSADGGQTWRKVSSADPSAANAANALPFGGNKSGLSFLNASTGWATGMVPVDNRAWFYVTHDGGVTWRPQPLSLPANVTSAQLALSPPTFFTSQDGILPVNISTPSVSSLYFYATHDGGAIWRSTSPLPASAIVSDFVDMQYGWATDRNMLYTTSDSGRRWQTLVPGTDFANVVLLDFVSHTTGWALRFVEPDTAHILKTSDGGQTWRQIY